MNKLEIVDKENNSFLSNKNSKKEIIKKENIQNIYFQYLLSKLRIANSINSKKNLIDNLITTIKNNNELFQLKEFNQILLHFYKFLQISILDNTISFIKSQLNLINLFIGNLYEDKNFILFYKIILPKLFDKFYIHNENINNSLISLFHKSILNNMLTIDDYYVYIENIILEDDNNYILNVLNFFNLCIKNDNNLNYITIPENIINIIKQKYNINNNDISELCKNILLILNNRNKKNEREFSKNDCIKNKKENELHSPIKKSKINKEKRISLNLKDKTDDIFQTLITNNNEFNEKNEDNTLISLNNEIMYLEGSNSLINNENDYNKINKSKIIVHHGIFGKKYNNKFQDNNCSSLTLTNFGVSTIEQPQDSDIEDEQDLFTLSNQNIDNSNNDIFQKTPVFSNFDSSGRLIKKNISNPNKDIEEIKPINLHDKFEEKNNSKEKFENIQRILGNEIVNLLLSQNNNNKIKGLKLITNLIKNREYDIVLNKINMNDLIEYLKIKINFFKEKDSILNSETIRLMILLISNSAISKEQTIFIILNYYDKIICNKLKKDVIDLINSSLNFIGLKDVIKLLITKLMDINNINLLKEFTNYFILLINNDKLLNFPAKEMIEYSKNLINNQNSKIKEFGIKLLCNIYKYIGKDIKYDLKDLNELKKIEIELTKIKQINSFKNKFIFSINNKDIIKENYSKTPIDISKKIDNKILNLISKGDSNEIIKGIEEIIKILKEANMNILPNGLKKLFSIINEKLKDSNKKILKLIIMLLSEIIEALKKHIKVYSSEIFLNLINKLKDKSIKKEIKICIEKMIKYIGIDSLIIYIPHFIKKENMEIEIIIEILDYIINYKNELSKFVGRMIFKELISILLIFLEDKKADIRNKSEELIKISLNFIPIDIYYKQANNKKNSNAIDILNKIKNEKLNILDNSKNINISKIKNIINNHDSLTNRKKMDQNNNLLLDSSFLSNYNSEQNENNLFNMKSKELFNKKLNKKGKINSSKYNNSFISLSLNSISNISEKNSTLNITSFNTERERNNSRSILFSGLKNKNMNNKINNINLKNNKKSFIKKEKKNINIFLLNIKMKENKSKRYNNDKKNNFDVNKITKEKYDKLKELSKNIFTNIFYKYLFNKDFQKEIIAYQNLIENLNKNMKINSHLENLDIILKIIGYRLNNTMNISLIKIILDYINALNNIINMYNYKLNDIEYNIIFSILIEKLVYLINQFIFLTNQNKIINLILNISINKNNKIKREIMDIIINLYKSQKININSNNLLSSLNNFYLSNSDEIVKNECKFLFQKFFSKIGKCIWDYIKIDEKTKKLIEEKSNEDINEKNLFIKLNRNRSYHKKKIFNRENDNELNKNGNNKIFYNTFINFNPKKNNQNKMKFSSEKNLNNKIKIKKISTMKRSMMILKENINDSNNSLNKNNRLNDLNKNSNDNCKDIYNYHTLTKEDLIRTINNLLSDNYLIKMNSIIILHEILCIKYEENKNFIIKNIEKIIDIFIKIINGLFNHLIKNIENNNDSLLNKFTKYIVITLCKLLSNKELIVNISYKTIYSLSEEIINGLLICENLVVELEDDVEKNLLIKSLNSSMMRILDNYNTTSILLILLELITNYYNKNNNIFILTILKCLEKKIQNIEKYISLMEIDAILLQIHLLLNKINKNLTQLNPKNEFDMMIISFIKKFIFVIIGYKKEKILDDYNKSVKNHFINDKYIIKWINEYIIKNKEKEIKGNIYDANIIKQKFNQKSLVNIKYNKENKKIINSFSDKNIRKFKY